MNNKFQAPKILENIVPFLIAGTAIAVFLGLLIMFSYMIVWGLIIGAVLWLIAVIKQFFFPSVAQKKEPLTKTSGRIIEHDDKK